MTIAKTINHILKKFGVTLVRNKTLEHLIQGQRTTKTPDEILLALNEIKNAVDFSQKQLLRHQISTKWGIVDLAEQRQALVKVMDCPLCHHQGELGTFGKFVTDCIFEGGVLIRHQCPECDVIFGPEKMMGITEASLSRDYEWHYQIFSEGDSTEQEIRAFHALKPKKGGVYLNWGAGAWSKTIDLLRQEGWDVYGYEPHTSASGHGSHIISSKEQLLTMQFDGIFSNNVLEHLMYPVRELSEMRLLLKSGGSMSHATPCFEYLYEYTRFHLFFFLGRSRSILADKAGLKVENYVVDGEFMNIILTVA
jgi:hypothetical protein